MNKEDDEIEEFNPFEIFTHNIEGISVSAEAGSKILQDGISISVAKGLLCFSWQRINQGTGRGLYIENACPGSRSVDVEWYRNGKLVQEVSYRITGKSRRKVREWSDDGKLVAETEKFTCRPGKMAALCTVGADARSDVDVILVDAGGGSVEVRLRNKSGNYIFAVFSGLVEIQTNKLAPYWGEILLPPIRTQGRVFRYRPGAGETFEVSEARKEPD